MISLLLMACATRTAPQIFGADFPRFEPDVSDQRALLESRPYECEPAVIRRGHPLPIPLDDDDHPTCTAHVVPDTDVEHLRLDEIEANGWEAEARACWAGRTMDRTRAEAEYAAQWEARRDAERRNGDLGLIAIGAGGGGALLGAAATIGVLWAANEALADPQTQNDPQTRRAMGVGFTVRF